LTRERGRDYIAVIKGMDDNTTLPGTEWLQGLVDEINTEAAKIIPSLTS